MSPEEFRRAAVKLFGPERGWQQRCADALKVDKASVSRWLRGLGVPGPVEAAMTCWQRERRKRKGHVAHGEESNNGEKAKGKKAIEGRSA
jgi:hypothetical protein